MTGDESVEGARHTHHLFQPDLAKSLNDAYDWVAHTEVPQFVEILRTMRKGRRDAMAMRALHAFALHRRVDELVELARDFDRRDAVLVMATAALSRPVGEAAELAAMQQEAESGSKRTPITDGIVHDVACQRTAFDVAVFVRVLKETALAERTVKIFAAPRSGRTNLDKVLLHTALCAEGCPELADQLLELTLRAIADSTPGTAASREEGEEGEEMADLAGAFQHVSPAGQVLELWVEKRLKASDATQVETTRQLVAKLIARRGIGHDALAEHIGRITQPRHLVKLCALLVKEEESPAKCALVRRYSAGHKGVQELATLVSFWHKEPALTRTTRDLLADIVAGPSAPAYSPRSPDELKQLDEWLPQEDAASECSRLLRYVAAVGVEGRSGAELVKLLGRVENRRERSRAAHEVGRRLAVAVMGPEGDRAWFVDCLRLLQEARHSVAVGAACRELSDPSSPGLTVDAALVADVAGGLHHAKLHKVSWTLLERFLENEQLVTPPDVVTVVGKVLELRLPEAELLLRATVGRWSDMRHRRKAVDALKAAKRDEAAEWVIKSLR